MAPVNANPAYNEQIIMFLKKIHFEIGHTLYLHNQLETAKRLYIVASDFCSKLYFSFLMKDISLLTFIIALPACCIKFSFLLSNIQRCFLYDVLSA